MPLKSISKHGARQCKACSKRTKERCKNPAAYGCKTCRMHGARKSESIKIGEHHPNFTHGQRTLQSQKDHSAFCRRLQQLEDAMHLLQMTSAKRSRGRKAKGYYKITSLESIKIIKLD